MGSSKKPKQQVAEYRLSAHMGVVNELDHISRIHVGEKLAWHGYVAKNQIVRISKPDLFGGIKKEGGVAGNVQVLMGGATQTLPSNLASKLNADTSLVPGFRGIVSLFFYDNDVRTQKYTSFLTTTIKKVVSGNRSGFYWAANSPYLKPTWVTGQRIPKGFYPEKAVIYNGEVPLQKVFEKESVIDMGTWSPNAQMYPAARYFHPDGMGARFAVSYYPNALQKLIDVHKSSSKSASYVETIYYLAKAVSDDISYIKNMFGHTSIFPGIPSYLQRNTGQYRSRATRGNGTVSAALSHYTDKIYSKVKGVTYEVAASGEMAIAIDHDGAIYTISSTQIRVFTATLTLLATYSVSLGTLALGMTTAQHDDNNLYVMNHDTGVLTMLTPDASEIVRTFTFPVVADKSYVEFSVRNGNLVRAYCPSVTTTEVRLKVESWNLMEYLTQYANANPIHMIYECLTNTDWGCGKSPDEIDTVSFTTAADICYAEGLGLSMGWNAQSKIENFIDEILRHIDGAYGVDPATNKIYVKLIRKEADISGTLLLNEDNCRVTKFQRKTLAETSNEAVVTWTNPASEKEETVVVHDMANFDKQGAIVSSSYNFYGVRSADVALRLATRELNKGSVPTAQVDIEVSRVGWNLKSGDIVRLTYDEHGLVELPLRVLNVAYGKPGDSIIRVNAIEDVFDMPASAYVSVNPTEWVSPSEDTSLIQDVVVGSAPYYFLARYLGDTEVNAMVDPEAVSMVMAAQPSSDATGFTVVTEETTETGDTNYIAQGEMNFTSRGILGGPLVKEVTSVLPTLTSLSDGEDAGIGSIGWIGDTPSEAELVMISDITGSTVTITRGVLDTVPKEWPAGSPIWFLNLGAWTGLDPKARSAGETVTYKLLTKTSTGELEVIDAPDFQATLDTRQYRPYRPADVKLNAESWPSVLYGGLSATWVERNRLFENPLIRAWNEGTITPEAGTTYTVTVRNAATNAIMHQTTGLTATSWSWANEGSEATSSDQIITVESVRDGYASWQKYSATVERRGLGYSLGEYLGGTV